MHTEDTKGMAVTEATAAIPAVVTRRRFKIRSAEWRLRRNALLTRSNTRARFTISTPNTALMRSSGRCRDTFQPLGHHH